MSYILEALRKADQERSAGDVPDLEADHETSHDPRRTYRWVWVIAAVLVANGVLLAALLWRGDRQDEALPATAEVPPATAKPPLTERPVPPQAVTLSRPAPRPAPPARQAPQPVVAAAPVSRQSPPVAPTVTAARVAPPAAPAPAEPTPAAVQPAIVPAGASSSGEVPFWDELPLEFRSGFDQPRLDVHVYDSDPSRRFLLIELKKYREGDTLASGALIEEILPDGVQLSYRGTRFIYRK